MSLTAVLLILCGLLAFSSAVVIVSALVLAGRTSRLEESGDWWAEGEEE